MKIALGGYKVLRPKMTVLLCCYVWGFERLRNIIVTRPTP